MPLPNNEAGRIWNQLDILKQMGMRETCLIIHNAWFTTEDGFLRESFSLPLMTKYFLWA